MIRTVPETAVRLYLGARIGQGDGGRCQIDLDGRPYEVSLEVLDQAQRVARALKIRPRNIQYATDILELRLHAEDLFMEDVFGVQDLRKILFVPAGDLMASAFYRARIPADILTDKGKAIAHFTDHLDLAKAVRYDVLWVQLSCSPILYRIASEAKKQGVKLIYDLDDLFDSIPPENPAAAIYVERKVEDVWKIIELADLVTVSTGYLRDYLEPKIGPKVRVLPNMIPAAITPERAPVPGNCTRILWAGSPTHKRDLAIVAPALSRILGRYNGEVRFTCFGERCPEGLPADCVDLIEFVPFMEYLTKLAEVGAHFGIAPLEDTPFNQAKCVSPSTFVSTPDGIVPIEAVLKDRVHDRFSPSTASLSRDGVFRKASHTYYHNACRTIRIKTSLGYEIEGTPTHRLMTSSGSWIPLEEASIGESLALERPVFSELPQRVTFNPWLRATSHKDRRFGRDRSTKSYHQLPVNLPTVSEDRGLLPEILFSEELSGLVGGILGDGSIGRSRTGSGSGVVVTCFSEDSDVIEWYARTFSLLGFNPKAYKETRARAVNVQVCSRNLAELLRSIGLCDSSYFKKFEVPSVVFRSPKKVIAAFVRALFESDACVSGSSVSFCTKSKVLASQVQLLLLGFGITSALRETYSKMYKKNYYKINLSRAGTDIYATEIGFLGTRKNEKLRTICSKKHSNAYTPIVLCDRVVCKEEGFSEVVDVTVPETESYWANGFVSHNSAVKHTEYSACGYPSLLSPVGEYKELPQEAGHTLVEAGDWERALDMAIGSPNSMTQLGLQAQEWVRKNRCVIRSDAAQWLEAANEVLA